MDTTNPVPPVSNNLDKKQVEKNIATAIPEKKGERLLVNISHSIVLILSLLLIIYISYDTFKGIPFMSNHHYMTFQFWVCIAFLADFFIEFFVSRDKKYYLKARWLFFVISIPYLNIINQFNLQLGPEVLFFVRFVPLLRGAYSMAMVLGYVSHNRAVSLMTQYGAILLVLVYSLSLIFYYEEHGINKNVETFWDALYWAAMNTNTVGCYFSAITPVGKVISVVLPTAGMLLLPLFTVFVTSKVQAFDRARMRVERMFASDDDKKADDQLHSEAMAKANARPAAPAN